MQFSAHLFACLAATTSALMPTSTSALHPPNHHPRTRKCVSQYGSRQDQYHAQHQDHYHNEYTEQDQHGYTQQNQYGYTQRNTPVGPVEWFFMDLNNQQNGPVNAEQMSRLYDNGHVGPDTYVWSPQKQPEWIPLSHSAMRYKHGRYDPRSTTQTYEQWLAATGSLGGWAQGR